MNSNFEMSVPLPYSQISKRIREVSYEVKKQLLINYTLIKLVKTWHSPLIRCYDIYLHGNTIFTTLGNI